MKPSPFTNITATFKNNEALLILCVQVALLHTGMGLITPILPLYAKTFSVSATMIGFLLTSQMLPRVFINVPTGRLADRWGAHKILVFAAGIVTLSAIGGGLAPNYTFFLGTRLLQGVGTGVSLTAGFAYAASISKPENRAQFISLYQGSFILGLGIGPMIGGTIAQYYGYQMPFFVYAVMAVIIGFWMYLRLPDTNEIRERKKPQSGHTRNLYSGRHILRHPGILLISLIGVVSGFTRGGIRNMAIALQADSLGMVESQIGLVMSGILLMTFAALYFMGNIAVNYDRKKITIGSWFLVALAILMISSADNFVTFLLSASLFGLAAGIGGVIPPVYVADIADDESSGLAIGILRTFSDGGAMLGPLAMGWIIDQASIRTGMLLNAALIIVVVSFFWRLAPELKMTEQIA